MAVQVSPSGRWCSLARSRQQEPSSARHSSFPKSCPSGWLIACRSSTTSRMASTRCPRSAECATGTRSRLRYRGPTDAHRTLTHNCAGARPAAPTEPFQRRQRPPPEARQAHTAAHQGDAEPQHTKGPVPLGAGERQWQWQRQGPQGRNLEPQILCRRRRRPGLAARAERIQHEIRRHPGEDQEAARQRRHHGRAGHPGVEAQETADAD
jgi:hypothetical protein